MTMDELEGQKERGWIPIRYSNMDRIAFHLLMGDKVMILVNPGDILEKLPLEVLGTEIRFICRVNRTGVNTGFDNKAFYVLCGNTWAQEYLVPEIGGEVLYE